MRKLFELQNIFHYPIIILLTCLFFIPLGFMFTNSFRYINYAKPSSKGEFIGIQNYKDIFMSGEFWHSIYLLAIFLAITLSSEIVIGMIIATLLDRIAENNFILSILLMPIMLAPIVVGMLGKFLFNRSFGIIPFIIGSLSGSTPKFFSSDLALPLLMGIEIWHWAPLLGLIFYSGILSLPKDPYDAAKVDGASPFQTFFLLTLPLLKPVVIVAVLIRGVDLMKIFDEILIMTGGGPGRSTELLNFYIYKTAFRSWNVGRASAMGSLFAMFSILVAFFLFRLIRRKA